MTQSHFDWDGDKDKANQDKHHVSFRLAQRAFSDPWLLAQGQGCI